jgi:hypothetical protein
MKPQLDQLEVNKALKRWLKKKGMTKGDLAQALEISDRSAISNCISEPPDSQNVSIFRLRARIEQMTGLQLWNDPAEIKHLTEAGKVLKIDLLTAGWKEIRIAAKIAGVTNPAIFEDQPRGMTILRELIGHFYPDAKTVGTLFQIPKISDDLRLFVKRISPILNRYGAAHPAWRLQPKDLTEEIKRKYIAEADALRAKEGSIPDPKIFGETHPNDNETHTSRS